MKKRFAIASVSLVLGLLAGGVLAYSMNKDEAQARNYCKVVEDGIEKNMSEGFANCYPPGEIGVNLSETVEEKSQIQCVCRKKVGDRVQTLTFSTSN